MLNLNIKGFNIILVLSQNMPIFYSDPFSEMKGLHGQAARAPDFGSHDPGFWTL